MAELPFLKNKNKKLGGSAMATVRAKTSDHMDETELLNQVASELIDAIQKKDHAGVVEALRALMAGIQEQDKIQDEEDAQ